MCLDLLRGLFKGSPSKRHNNRVVTSTHRSVIHWLVMERLVLNEHDLGLKIGEDNAWVSFNVIDINSKVRTCIVEAVGEYVQMTRTGVMQVGEPALWTYITRIEQPIEKIVRDVCELVDIEPPLM